MRLVNSFTVPAPPEVAWPILTDVPRIAPCMPGAELTEVVDPSTFKGKSSVRIGPVTLAFAGTARIVERDDANRTAKVEASGADTKGRGTARANVVFSLLPDPAGSRVEITTDLDLSGSVAQYGRASGLIAGIAGEIVADFAANLRELISEGAGPAAALAEADVGVTADAPAPPAPSREAPRPVSGLSLLWRGILAMIRGWFSRPNPNP